MILERAIVGNAGLAEMPGKINFLAVVRSEELNMAFFKIAKKATQIEDRFDILGEVLDRVFQRVNTAVQIVFSVRKPVRLFGGADQLVHENKIVGAAVRFFFGFEEP